MEEQATHAAVDAAWQAQLGPEHSTPDTDFFAAGGNSLLAAAMMDTLSTEFDHFIPLRLLSTNPTLAKLRNAVADELRTGDDA